MPLTNYAIAVSSCLLGHKIRYDGNDKRNKVVEEEICNRFSCIPVCPEYAIGLGVPRHPVHLVQIGGSIRVLGVSDSSQDITDLLGDYADFVCNSLPQICGYIFKARSPSCGLIDTPVFNERNDEISKGRGAYASRIALRKPTLPVIDEIHLAVPAMRIDFIQRVENYARHL